MSLPRKIQEFRAGTLIATAVAAIAAGTAIPAYATGVFDSPPPACYISSPTTGATVSGTTTVSATCGSSTVNTQFLLDHSFIIGIDGSSPFSSSWNSTVAPDGVHSLTVFACNQLNVCVESGTVSVTTSNPGGAPVNTAAPVISGSQTVGAIDTCSTGTWTGDVSSGYAFQWKDGAGNISGQTSQTYTVGAGETGLFIHCTVTASGTGGSASADSSPVGPVASGGGGGGTLNGCGTGGSTSKSCLWVSTSGISACSRSATALTYSAALAGGNVCDTGPHAYTKASLGDTILIESSTFTTQWNFSKLLSKSGTTGTCNYNYGGASDFSNCITFVPASGQSFGFAVTGSNVNQVRICSNFVAIENATVTETDYTDSFGDTVSNDAVNIGAGDNTCGSVAIHDVYLANDTLGGRIELDGGAINAWMVGGAILSVKDLSPQLGGGGGNNGSIANTNHSGIVGVTFDGQNFADTDPAHHHMECLHDSGGSNHIVVAGSRFLSCPVEGAFFQTSGSAGATGFGPVQDNILIENNYFDNDGANALKIDCTNTNCQNTNITVRFNTFAGSLIGLQNACNSNGACSGAVIDNNSIYGNIGIGCPSIAFGTNGVTGSLWTTSYNIQTGAQANLCAGDSTSLYSQTVTLASKGPPNYNDDLSGAQAATNFVPNSVTWPLSGGNIYGTTRSGAHTNAGAD